MSDLYLTGSNCNESSLFMNPGTRKMNERQRNPILCLGLILIFFLNKRLPISLNFTPSVYFIPYWDLGVRYCNCHGTPRFTTPGTQQKNICLYLYVCICIYNMYVSGHQIAETTLDI